MKDNKVKFVRIRGKIVPIKSNGNKPMSTKSIKVKRKKIQKKQDKLRKEESFARNSALIGGLSLYAGPKLRIKSENEYAESFLHSIKSKRDARKAIVSYKGGLKNKAISLAKSARSNFTRSNKLFKSSIVKGRLGVALGLFGAISAGFGVGRMLANRKKINELVRKKGSLTRKINKIYNSSGV